MPNRQLSGYQYNSSSNTRVFVREMIVKDNLFLGDNCNLVYGLNSQVSFSKTMATEEAQIGLTDSSGNPTSYVTTTTMEEYITQQIEYQLGLLKLDLPNIYRLTSENVVMSENKAVRWSVGGNDIDVLFISNLDQSLFFQYHKSMYLKSAKQIVMGIGSLTGNVAPQLSIDSDGVTIEKLKVNTNMNIDQISGNTKDAGLLVENFSMINNTIYSITPYSETVEEYHMLVQIRNIDGVNKYIWNGNTNLVEGQHETITMIRGAVYYLTLDVTGHPFHLQSTGGGYVAENSYPLLDSYDGGVSHSNGLSGVDAMGQTGGVLKFQVPKTQTTDIYYQCGLHNAMGGVIRFIDNPNEEETRFYSYNPYRLMKRFVYTLITTSQNTIEGEKTYYLDLDGSVANNNGILTRLRRMINPEELVMVCFDLNLDFALSEDVQDTVIVSIFNHRKRLPSISDSNGLAWDSDSSNNRFILLTGSLERGGFGIKVTSENRDIVNEICSRKTSEFEKTHVNWLRDHGIGDVLIKEYRLVVNSNINHIKFGANYPLSSVLQYDSSIFAIKIETVNDNSFQLRGNENQMPLLNNNSVSGNQDHDIRSLSTGQNYQNIQVDLFVGHNSTHQDSSVISYHNMEVTSSPDPYVSTTDPLQ